MPSAAKHERTQKGTVPSGIGLAPLRTLYARAAAGTLIGQYALSEYQGYLRVATTVGAPSPAPEDGVAPGAPSDNRVTVLQPQNGALVTVGSLGGLGSGEKIYAVRFIGTLGFVVTFRQTDPLYVVDVSVPLRAAGQPNAAGACLDRRHVTADDPG